MAIDFDLDDIKVRGVACFVPLLNRPKTKVIKYYCECKTKEPALTYYLDFLKEWLRNDFTVEKVKFQKDNRLLFTVQNSNSAMLYLTAMRYLDEYSTFVVKFCNQFNSLSSLEERYKALVKLSIQTRIIGHGFGESWEKYEDNIVSLEQFYKNLNLQTRMINYKFVYKGEPEDVLFAEVRNQRSFENSSVNFYNLKGEFVKSENVDSFWNTPILWLHQAYPNILKKNNLQKSDSVIL